MRNAMRLAAAALLLPALLAGLAAAPEGGSGLASRYTLDRGIERDKAVIFADDFENWGADGKGPGRWTQVYANSSSLTSTAPGKISGGSDDGAGSRVLVIQCWYAGGSSATGGVALHLGNYEQKDRNLGDGYDEVYLRYYVMVDPTYKPMANHGINLGGRDLSRPDSRYVGVANTRDVAAQRYFFSGLQPTDDPRDFHLEFYSYHMDKPNQWGDIYPIQNKVPIKLGRWYCVERHMKLNTVSGGVVKADGVEELWVDGQLSIRREGLRFRNIPTLHITMLAFETYYHHPAAEWTRARPIKVCFDHVVVARSYIGPMSGKGKAASGGGKTSLPPGWDPGDRN